ncbi:TlpA family protein disulfide reductase, partial [Nocardia sp. NPDC004582]
AEIGRAFGEPAHEIAVPLGAVGDVDAQRVPGVVAELADAELPPLDLEVDIDEFAELARELNVLSLPTTFGLDSRGLERFRISGVPKAADLRTSMASLTVSTADE